MPIKIKKIVQIPKGSIHGIVSYLKRYELIHLNILDKYIIGLFGQPQSGWIDFKKRILTKADFFYFLTHSKAAVDTITLIPGETNYFFLRSLSKKFKLDLSLLYQYYQQIMPLQEGYIVPDTYNIPIGLSEKRVITILYSLSRKRHISRARFFLGLYNKKQWFRYLKIASIIEKESANKKEMPIVASVVYNRLKKGMRLQMDGTLNYGQYSHKKITPYRINNDKSKFNTYKYSGLPHLPICSVSYEAIRSAINPAKTNYLYFMKNKKGVHDFSRYYFIHLKNIRNKKR